MLKKLGLNLLSFLIGYPAARLLMTYVLIPLHANFKENLDTEFIIMETIVMLSFSFGVRILLEGFVQQTNIKKYGILGLYIPFSFIVLTLTEGVKHDHVYSCFWVNLCLGIVFAGTFMAMTHLLLKSFKEMKDEQLTEKIEEKQEMVAPKQVKEKSVSFFVDDELKVRIHSIIADIDALKQMFSSDIEMQHEIEKNEKQLEESVQFYQSINAKYKAVAKEKLEAILSSMEEEIEEYMDAYNQEQLRELDKILIQKQR